jgi:predicted nucleic acid-binding protein
MPIIPVPHLLDTNILTRYALPGDPHHQIAVNAIDRLDDAGAELYVTAQNIVEFWSVATRPATSNGLGWTVATTITEVTRILSAFAFLDETAAIFPQWQSLVTGVNAQGRQVHDARLAAVALVHGIEHILTFNVSDFTRFASSKIVPVDPATI